MPLFRANGNYRLLLGSEQRRRLGRKSRRGIAALPCQAARAYQRALVLRPDFVAADFNLGTIFVEQGNPDGAIAAWRSRLEENPGDPAALGALDRLYERTERWRDLVQILESRRDLVRRICAGSRQIGVPAADRAFPGARLRGVRIAAPRELRVGELSWR